VQCRRGKLGPLAAELVFGESGMLANLSRQSAQVDR